MASFTGLVLSAHSPALASLLYQDTVSTVSEKAERAAGEEAEQEEHHPESRAYRAADSTEDLSVGCGVDPPQHGRDLIFGG